MKLNAYAFVIAALLTSAAVAAAPEAAPAAAEEQAQAEPAAAPELEINAAQGADVNVTEDAPAK